MYIPSINNWWNLINDTVKAIFISQVMHLDPNSPVLILATSDESYETLPAQVSSHIQDLVYLTGEIVFLQFEITLIHFIFKAIKIR